MRKHPPTPDGRYFVVRSRLWRCTDPQLAPERRDALVRELMAARRAVRAGADDAGALAAARAAVDAANRKMAKSTPYAAWFDELCGG